MSVPEDIELRDLVSKLLEENGTLAKIRAELRAKVFLALEEHTAENKLPIVNHALKEYLTRAESALGLCLVREFLEYLQLDNTLAVFNTETHHGKNYEYKGRNMLSQVLHLEKFKDKKGPLLSFIVQVAQESLGLSITSAQTVEEHQAGDFEANIQSPQTHMPSSTSYTEISSASLDHSQNLLNQTFTTGTLVTSFGSPGSPGLPDTSLEKQSPKAGCQTFQSKMQATNEKKPQLGGSDGDIKSKDSEGFSGLRQGFGSGDSKNLLTKDKSVHTISTNPQTSLSNLPPLGDLKLNKHHGDAQKSLFNALKTDDIYEEDFSSDSSGASDKGSRGKSEQIQFKKDADSGTDKTSSKKENSPVASVSEELEGDTNSVTDDVNSAASADTLDSSLSYLGTKHADHIEKI